MKKWWLTPLIHEWASNVSVVSRIIGLPGEKLTITNTGSVLIDDTLLEEQYVTGETKIYPWDQPMSYTIPENHYYLLNDYRESQRKDSRHLGPYAHEQIEGTFYPAPPRIQKILAPLIQD